MFKYFIAYDYKSDWIDLHRFYPGRGIYTLEFKIDDSDETLRQAEEIILTKLGFNPRDLVVIRDYKLISS